MIRYTPEMEGWLRSNYGRGHLRETLDAFEAEFGQRPTERGLYVKACKMGLRKSRRGEVPDRAERPVRWCEEPEMAAWMETNDRGQRTDMLSTAFAAEFGFPLSRAQISLWRSSHGRTTRRGHLGGERHEVPVGTERVRPDGYTWVKVRDRATVGQSKNNWVPKQQAVWERENGPLPEGHVVVFADRNRANFDPDNLVAVPRRIMAQLNDPRKPAYSDRETLLARVAAETLGSAVIDAEAAMPRRCEVCGEQFVPEGARRYQAGTIKTCPACLAKGLRARGTRRARSGPATAPCAVCGREFERKASNQRRCPECAAREPLLSAEQQRRKERR